MKGDGQMTVRDLFEQCDVEGYVQVRKWDKDGNYVKTVYDKEDIPNHTSASCKWADEEITYIFPTTSYKENKLTGRQEEVPQIVIEIEERD